MSICQFKIETKYEKDMEVEMSKYMPPWHVTKKSHWHLDIVWGLKVLLKERILHIDIDFSHQQWIPTRY